MDGSPMWLLREGSVLASAEVATSLGARMRGLLGRDGIDGALLLLRTRSVHSVGMRFALDVAFLSRELEVMDVVHLAPGRIAWPRLRCRMVLEAEAGAFERWQLRRGDRLELRGIE
jgi:uncharacterized membrane protein (UPF0127 family)